jgi:acyl-homoserine-lactone acylase
MFYKICINIAIVVIVLSLMACSQKTRNLNNAEKYNVRILRDNYGVPHIYGKTDADVAYGLAYAHCEDDFETIQQMMLLARGIQASIKGAESAPFDYLVKLFRFREIVEEKYKTDLSPETRAICEAYADGYNYYAKTHPEKVVKEILPCKGQDIITGFTIMTPSFFGLQGVMQGILKSSQTKEFPKKISKAFGLDNDIPIGSNTFSIAPSRTPDGKTHLAINSHQPWTGQAAWYEARLKSEDGLDIVGSLFPGSPVILHGHNRNLGWAHTVNNPDLIDVYVLEINPNNKNQYKFDGKWRDLKVDKVKIKVKLKWGIKWTVKREALYSVYGPVLRQPNGTYAIRYAGYGDIRQIEQWYKMGKSRNIKEFEKAMRMQAIPCFNVGYADKEGNIWYIYNALLPLRTEGYDWKKYLPGNTSETLWDKYLPFDKLPQVKNPASGFIQSCNSTPYQTTIGAENPRPEDFSSTFGIEKPSFMTNRSLRLLELLGADESITEKEFYDYKYDMKYSSKSLVSEVLRDILNSPPSDDPVVQEAVEILRKWDLSSDPDNSGMAIAVLSMESIVRDRMYGSRGPDTMKILKEKAHLLKNTFGRIDVAWKEVNHLVRGKVEVGMGGGPDILHAVYGNWENGRFVGKAGDCYILMVTWDSKGKVHSSSIHQFGSATLDESSPHYADQVPLFVARKTKPVWLDESELRQHLEAEYRPGEPRFGNVKK